MTHFRLLPSLSAAALAATLLAGSAAAQNPITVTAAGYPVAPGTTYRWQRLQAPPAVPVLVGGPNQTWDFRALPLMATPTVSAPLLVPPPNPAFPTATVASAYTRGLGALQVQGVQYYALTPTGYVSLGAALRRQAFPIGSATGSSLDSVIILAQNLLYQPPQPVLVLPTTAGTGFRYADRTPTQVQLTVTALGLNRAPVQYIERSAVADSVIGWGTIRVPVRGQAGGSALIPVLLRRVTKAAQDSFYVAGQPAPAALLGALGLVQGAASTFTYDTFQRNNSAQSVFSISYATLSRQQATFSVSAEPGLPLRAPALVPPAAAALWPNPVAAGQALRVEVGGLTEPVAATLRDALGRPVLTLTLRPQQPLPLPATLAPGAYLLTADLPDGRLLRRRVVVE